MTQPAFPLAACAEMIFLDRPFTERVRIIHDAGFLVEIWDWTAHDIDGLATLREEGVVFNSMTGYIRGSLTADGSRDLLDTAEESIAVAKRLGIGTLNLHGTGLGEGGLPVRPVERATGPMWVEAVDTLRRIADLGARHDVRFVLENLNTAVDHPGVPFATAADCLALVAAVDSPHLKLMLDLYHVQIGEGQLIETCRTALPHIGEIQVADVPGRCEPGTGEINYAGVARALSDLGYSGVVGMEAFAAGDSHAALDRFRDAFSL
ncbi:MAG: TIM barrel protein [Actinomycetales bacterium]